MKTINVERLVKKATVEIMLQKIKGLAYDDLHLIAEKEARKSCERWWKTNRAHMKKLTRQAIHTAVADAMSRLEKELERSLPELAADELRNVF